MLVKIISNGVEVEAEISEQDLKKLCPDLTPKKKTGWEKVKHSEMEFCISDGGKVYGDIRDNSSLKDRQRDEVANNFNNEELAKNIARAEALHRNLLRRSTELCDKINWDNNHYNSSNYCIVFDWDEKCLDFSSGCIYQDFGQVYFDTEEHAQQVAEEFRDELIWYFTEFKERMD